jgi:hypothetical protein
MLPVLHIVDDEDARSLSLPVLLGGPLGSEMEDLFRELGSAPREGVSAR